MLKSSRIISNARFLHSSNALFIQAQTKNAEPRPFSEIPEPKKLPIFGTMFDYSPQKVNAKTIFQHFRNRHKELGPIYKETVLPGLLSPRVFCCSPEDAERLFREEEAIPIRDAMGYLQIVREKLGVHTGLLNVQGEEWYKIRKIVNQHMVNYSSLWDYTEQHLQVSYDLADYISSNLDDKNEVPDFQDVMNRWAIEGTGVAVLDTRFGALNNTMDENLNTIMETNIEIFDLLAKLSMSVPFWRFINTKDMKSLYRVQQKQLEAIRTHCKKVAEKSKPSKLQRLLANSELPSSVQEIMVSDLLFAGVDTTLNSSLLLLYCLATNPDKQDLLREEVFELLSNGEITGKRMHQMKYLHACKREAQRLFPLTPGTEREFRKDIVISGYKIPAGIKVSSVSNIVNNRDPKYFDDPDAFIPERWFTSSRKDTRFVMTGSFGYGPRMCPGRRFAMQELDCLVVALLSRYRIEYHYEPFEIMFQLFSKPIQEPRFSFLPLTR